MIARRLRIHGRVQGVSFRDWTRRTARSRALTGWVRNVRDGSVEVFVAGPVDRVEAFVADCRRGPAGARVDRLDQIDEAPVPIEGFAILPTTDGRD